MSGGNTRQVILRGGQWWKRQPELCDSYHAGSEIRTAGTTGALSLEVRLELKVIADVGLVGFPNVGKSTLTVPSDKCAAKDRQLSFHNFKPESGRC